MTASARTEVRDQSFEARLVSQDLGPLRVSELRAPLHFWSRDAADVRRDDQDVYMLSLLSRGRGELNQYGRRAVQGPGDIVLYDSSAAFQYDLDAETRLVKIPKALFDQRVGKPRDLVSVSFPCTAPLAPMLSAMITEATRLDLSDLSQNLVGARLANSIIDVLIAMCDVFREEQSDVAASARLDKVLRYARANIGDRDLTPQSLSQIGGVSVRSLNRMFGAMGTTAMRWVWAERLKASRDALRQKQVGSITEAAFLFGFADLGHFSRSYKDAFGETPTATLHHQ
ncbi:helix-turn-helix domain-containing protein [Acidisoma cellulosilytica]|uniref:Helix-turn-helix domain-containing protein n=1 Tax=Acidisoma cellulosilyticum TaxID=2802395 RepID=A0A963Z279_9PROT|nr:helix-turn-helix domain-containing protein [Acidisoma cellulosilyticum]